MDTPFWTIDTLFYTEILNCVHPKFVFYLFNIIDWLRYNEASGVPSLNASTIENIEVRCPHFLEQQAIADILTDLDAEIAALEQKRYKTRALKKGMMQELLTGKTRLI
jgi:type I restriction enzyme S subunit